MFSIYSYFTAQMLSSNKLSDWIVVGVILFVAGVVVAFVLAVLLFLRIKALCMWL